MKKQLTTKKLKSNIYTIEELKKMKSKKSEPIRMIDLYNFK